MDRGSIARGTVVAVSVGRTRRFDYQGKPAQSAIWKSPVTGPVAVRGVNLEGDEQADRKAHGGPDKAVYAYAIEDSRWWEVQLGRAIAHAEFGENLTTRGVDVNDAVIGERWELGSVVLEVSEPRVPCWRLGVRMQDKSFVRTFTQAGRPGAYFRIVREGSLSAGDEIRVVQRPEHGLTIAAMFRIYTHERQLAARLLDVPQVSEPWKAWAQRIHSKSR